MTTIFCAMVAGFLIRTLIDAVQMREWVHVVISATLIAGCLFFAIINL